METILVNLISDVFSIAGQFYDDLQSVPLTIDELKQSFQRAGIIVSEKSIEEITLHLETLASLSKQRNGHARILTETEERVLKEYEEDVAAMYKAETEAIESDKELEKLLEDI